MSAALIWSRAAFDAFTALNFGGQQQATNIALIALCLSLVVLTCLAFGAGCLLGASLGAQDWFGFAAARALAVAPVAAADRLVRRLARYRP